jgi:hypothetical protein
MCSHKMGSHFVYLIYVRATSGPGNVGILESGCTCRCMLDTPYQAAGIECTIAIWVVAVQHAVSNISMRAKLIIDVIDEMCELNLS